MLPTRTFVAVSYPREIRERHAFHILSSLFSRIVIK
jgi:hypothetical protein